MYEIGLLASIRLDALSVCLFLSACGLANSSPIDARGVLVNEVESFSLPDDVQTIAWSPDQTRLALVMDAGFSNRLSMYSLAEHRMLWPAHLSVGRSNSSLPPTIFFDPTGEFLIGSIALPPDERRAPSVPNSMFELVPANTGEGIREIADDTVNDPPYMAPSLIAGHVPFAQAIALSPDGSTLAVVMSFSGTVALFDTHTWTLRKHLGPLLGMKLGNKYGLSLFIQLLLDTQHGIVIGYDPAKVETLSIEQNERLASFQPFSPDVGITFALDPKDGNVIVAGGSVPRSDDPFIEQLKQTGNGPLPFLANAEKPYAAVRKFDSLTGKQLLAYFGPNERTEALAVSADGHFVAASQGGGRRQSFLTLWDGRSGAVLGCIQYDKVHWPHGVAFSPDSKKLAYSIGASIHIVNLQ